VPQVTGSDQPMDKTNKRTQQGDIWSWAVIGLVFCTVMTALYGPFVWELTHDCTFRLPLIQSRYPAYESKAACFRGSVCELS